MTKEKTIRDMTKSALMFPWAISMLGVQQVVNLVVPPKDGRVAGATAAFDAVTDAAEEQLTGWLDQTWRVGKTVQRALADLAKWRRPWIDSSGVLRMAEGTRLAPLFQATVEYGMQPIAWLDSLRVARDDSDPLMREFVNKLHVIRLVTDVRSRLRLGDADDEPLTALLERASDVETFARLWAVEGLGHYYGERALARAGAAHPRDLTDEATAGLPSWSLPMLHAGIGIAFAKDVLDRLAPTSSRDVVRDAIERFIALCRRWSRQSCAGAAFESLGLVTRALWRNMVPILDREIPEVDPALHGYFWHGVGRAMYFDPMDLLPSSNAPRSLIVDLEREASHDLAYHNALSGIAWSATLANMQDPEVMEVFLRYHGALAVGNDAFSDGVSSAVVVRHETTPRNTDVNRFIDHEPRSCDAAAAAWRALVAAPCRLALERRHAGPQQAGALEELFHYRPGPA